MHPIGRCMIRLCDAGEVMRLAEGGPQGNVSSLASLCLRRTRDKWFLNRLSLKHHSHGVMLGPFDGVIGRQNAPYPAFM
jgi:uncharacterized protein YodC (DUF2158 family)